MSISAYTASWSEMPGMMSVLRIFDGMLVISHVNNQVNHPMCDRNTPCGRKNVIFETFVGAPYFSTLSNFVSEMTLGHVVTSALGYVVTLLQWSR